MEIEKWLKRSEIIKYTFLLTWLDWNDPVVRIATNDFINNWEDFYHAGGGEGLILLTEDGKLFLEFTDDWKYHLHSNFEIKPNTEVILKR